jgi:hypothetical protein
VSGAGLRSAVGRFGMGITELAFDEFILKVSCVFFSPENSTDVDQDN